MISAHYLAIAGPANHRLDHDFDGLHYANRRFTSLWRLHAVHHSREELHVLFIVQAGAAVIAAVLLLATRNLLIVVGSALLMIGTIVGFILARTVGIFGFSLSFSSGLANAE
jgi:hypothetical protein